MIKQIALLATAAALCTQSVYAGKAEAEKWVNDEFQPSSLSKSAGSVLSPPA